MRNDSPRLKNPTLQALWNMRLPALYTCGPPVGVILIDLFFGLPNRLWFLAGGFFIFSLVLFAVLVRGESRRLRQAMRRN